MSIPHVVECKDALDYFKKINEFGRRGWIYRGHSNADWPIKSSLCRFLELNRKKIQKRNWYGREKETIKRFQSYSHLYLKRCPEIKDFIQWLPIMQHYGCPTRLIDFTLNPTIALYFALRDVKPIDTDYCVHAIHIDSVRRNSYHIRKNGDTKM